jgi:hypothetical protein
MSPAHISEQQQPLEAEAAATAPPAAFEVEEAPEQSSPAAVEETPETTPTFVPEITEQPYAAVAEEEHAAAQPEATEAEAVEDEELPAEAATSTEAATPVVDETPTVEAPPPVEERGVAPFVPIRPSWEDTEAQPETAATIAPETAQTSAQPGAATQSDQYAARLGSSRRYGSADAELPIEVSDEERRLHNDARRFARLLVSEIKLYNEQKVKEGRTQGNIYERLREDIDRSRQMYDKRVAPPVAARYDYFHQELVNTLAEGDPAKLGEAYPGAAVSA